MGSSADLRVAPATVKVFTVDEANSLLGRIEGILEGMDANVAREGQLRELVEDIEQYYAGDLVNAPPADRERHADLRRQAGGLSESLDRDLVQIQSMGCLVKNVTMGLVDFHGIVDGELVFLCWKRGEKRIENYHPLNTGFPGRKRLPTPL